MTGNEFLADTDVAEAARWVADRFDRQSGWAHNWTHRKSGERWRCDSLHDAFRQYRSVPVESA